MESPPQDVEGKKKICFDYSHANQLRFEKTPFHMLTDFLDESDFILGYVEKGLNEQYLQQFDCLVIGNPYSSFLEMEEIQVIKNFVKDGGGLLVISDQGGDYGNRNNLSELTGQFGIYFNPDHIYDADNYLAKEDYVVISDLRPHFITQGISRFIHSSGCSLHLDTDLESDVIFIEPLGFSSESAYRRTFNGMKWVEEPCPQVPILAVAKYHKGKVVTIGNISMFSSLGSSYGLKLEDNKMLVGNLFSWLLNKAADGADQGVPVLVSLKIDPEMYYWVMKVLHKKEWKDWKDLSGLVNLCLRSLRMASLDLSFTPSEEKLAEAMKASETIPVEEISLTAGEPAKKQAHKGSTKAAIAARTPPKKTKKARRKKTKKATKKRSKKRPKKSSKMHRRLPAKKPRKKATKRRAKRPSKQKNWKSKSSSRGQ